MTETIQPHDCYSCGKKVQVYIGANRIAGQHMHKAQVRCDGCHMRGPQIQCADTMLHKVTMKDLSKEAIKAWNRISTNGKEG